MSQDTSDNDQSKNSDAKEAQEVGPSFYVVGIGASAGGFEALERFFGSMRPDSGMAFVVVQHLSPDHKSLMVELLSKHTEMEVLQATEGMSLEANHIYLIPPKKNMTVLQGKLHLADKTVQSLNFPIDIFLNSLADDKGEQAIGIVLSGTGSDGTRGIRNIKEQGGIIMVQDLDSAKFDGMPSNAIATGLADYILPPEKMPEELIKYVQHPFVATQRTGESWLLKEENKLERIFALLKEHSGLDFTHYKQSTVSRRIERRLSVNQIEKLEDYVNYLYQNQNEVQTLYKELLIGVTRFFRDPDAYAILKEKVIPEIIKAKQGSAIRVWVAGCSTGEEAYSLAIMFREALENAKAKNEVKIFATDVDTEALEFASIGQYPENIVADLTSERFRSYFVRKGDKCQIANHIREMVIFAQHNVIKDPPFNKIDLLSCRNLLIYLQPVLQKKVLMSFNFALNEGGFLFQGSSETIGHFTNLFTSVDTKWKIYRSRGKQTGLSLDSFSVTPVYRKRELGSVMDRVVPQHVDQRKQVATIYESLFKEYVPPGAIINSNHELVHVLGEVSDFLKIQPGNINLNIQTLIRSEFSIAVETGISKAMREDNEVVYNDIRYTQHGEEHRATLRIIPFLGKNSGNELLLVVFDRMDAESRSIETTAKSIPWDGSDQRINDLEHELQYTRENLQATIEELETTNEELQATNEELLSANEELQSANEELQSVNEELITVNSEYQSKIQELTELNNDMNNLLLSTNIGTIFLDKDLRIRKFTPAISREINLMETDIGRPISHIVFNINYDNILNDSRKVLHTLAPFEREVQTAEGKWLLLRILPYRTDDNMIKGVVITFIDISSLKKATEELSKLSYALELSPSIVLITDAEGTIEYVNNSFTQITGFSSDEVIGRNTRIFKTGETPQEEYDDLWEAVHSGRTWSGMFVNRKKNRELFWEDATIVPVKNEDGTVVNLLKVAEDVTERRKSRDKLEQSRLRVMNILESTTDSYVELDADWRFKYVNLKAEKLLGKSRDLLLGKQIWDIFPETVQSELFRELHSAKSNGKNTTLEEYLSGFDAWMEFHVFPLNDSVALYFRDITQRKKTEQELLESEARFRSTFSQAAVGLGHLTFQGNWIRVNEKLCEIVGKDREQVVATNWKELVFSDDIAVLEAEVDALRRGNISDFSLEVRIVVEDTPIWTTITASLSDDSQSQTKYIIVVVEDISRRKLAELSLEQEHKIFQGISEASPVSIVLLDNEGKLVYANHLAEELLGLTKDALIKRTFDDSAWRITTLDGAPYAEDDLPFNIVMRTKKTVFDVRHCIEDIEGSRRMLSINAAPVLGTSGDVSSVVTTIMDITEDVTSRADLQHQRVHLEHMVAQCSLELGSEAYYLDSLDSIFLGLDRQGNIILLNKRGREVLGKGSDHFFGENWFDIALLDDERETAKKDFERLMQGDLDPFEQVRYTLKDFDGNEVLVSWHNKLTYDEQGQVSGLLSSGRILKYEKR